MGKNVESEIVYEILAYLVENPDAGDTMEGIAEWWLLEQRIKRGTDKVERALDELVAKGFILERKGENSRIHYRIQPDKQ
jgi:hypothetical protein